MADRQRVMKKRVTGELIQWKGKYGWIMPSEAIQHEAATKRGGKIYLAMEDIEGGEIPVKSMVTFFVYVDSTGLGAMNCRSAPGAAKPSKGDGKGGVIKTIQKPKGSSITGKAGGKGVVQNGKGTFWQPTAKVKGIPLKAKAKAKSTSIVIDLEERSPPAAPAAPDKTVRERVVPKRVIGRLFRWKGNIGWIRPQEPIDHLEASKHRGGIYLHENDVQTGHDMFQGAQVTFFVYSDGNGLGAEHCMLTKDQPPEEPAPQKGAKGCAKGGGKAVSNAATKVTGKGKGKGKGGAGEKMTMVQKVQLKKKNNNKDKKADGEDGEKKEGGPDLPRERVTILPVSGEVLVWKGKFGWLSSSETIEHEKSTKNGGKVWVHEKDILAGGPLTKGQPVEFHVYADASGLGAEEVIALSS